MKIPFNRQSQFELFPDAVDQKPRKEQSYIFGRTFQFSFENLIVAGIVMLMAMVVAFSFGIERGHRHKKMARQRKIQLVEAVQADPHTAALRQDAASQGPEDVLTGSLPGNAGSDQVSAPAEPLRVQEADTASGEEKTIDKTASLETIHTVQVASFKQLSRAEREAEDLKKLGYDAFTAKKGTYYIICVGRFSERQQANELLKPLRKRYSDCYVRRL